MKNKKGYFSLFSAVFIGLIAIFGMKYFYDLRLERIQSESLAEVEMKSQNRVAEQENLLKSLYDTLPDESFKDVEIININSDIFDRLNLGENATIVFLGDSTTEQNFQTNGEPVHVGIIEDKLKEIYKYNIDIVNSGVSGNSIKEMQDRLQSDVISKRPDLVVINSSLNDIRIELSNQEFDTVFREVIEEIQDETDADIILRTSNVTVEGYERLESDMNPIIKNLAQEYDLGYIDLYQYYKNIVEVEGIEKYNNDNVHPNENGQMLIADIVLHTLLSSGIK